MTGSAGAAPSADPESEEGDLTELLERLREVQGVPTGGLVRAIETAVPAAWSELEPAPPRVEAKVDPESGRLRVELVRLVVEGEPSGPAQISLQGALELDPEAEIGGLIRVAAEIPQAVVARAARMVKAEIGLRAREARAERLQGEAQAQLGKLVDSLVERFRRDTVLLRAGELQAYLPPVEQIPGERLIRGRHLQVVLLESRRSRGEEGVMVRASRTSPLLLRRLLEKEVPELQEGQVVIRSIAREPGARSKVAVESKHPGVDAKGACIGAHGVRIRTVVAGLAAEKVDIVEWSENPQELVARSLAPAPVASVSLDWAAHRATVQVAAQNLTLAIGKEGQNARLAARLSGWRIDIRADAAKP